MCRYIADKVSIFVFVEISINFYLKNFDYPEKPLKYKHIRRISD